MKRTVVSILALVFFFSAGLHAVTKFQFDAQKKADDFSMERPLIILAFDIAKERQEDYEIKTFVPEKGIKATLKKLFTGKEQGTEQIETGTRNITVIDRLKLYTESKRKMYEVQELTPTEIKTISKRIFDGIDFFDVKKNSGASMVKINPEFIALSVLPDWYYMHKKYMKDAVETEEKIDNKSYRFVNGKTLRYYVNKETMQIAIAEFDTTDKNNRERKTVNKIVFGPGTFKYGKHNIVNQVSIYKDNKLVKKYNVSVLKGIDVLKDFVFDPEIQSKDLNQPPKKRKASAAEGKTAGQPDTKAQEE